jgi:hypothetical protein
VPFSYRLETRKAAILRQVRGQETAILMQVGGQEAVICMKTGDQEAAVFILVKGMMITSSYG